MAEQADGVDLGPIQHVRIRPAMRNVAGGAAFGLHHRMFIHKRSGDFRVALRADDVLLRGRPLKPPSDSAVWLVARCRGSVPPLLCDGRAWRIATFRVRGTESRAEVAGL